MSELKGSGEFRVDEKYMALKLADERRKLYQHRARLVYDYFIKPPARMLLRILLSAVAIFLAVNVVMAGFKFFAVTLPMWIHPDNEAAFHTLSHGLGVSYLVALVISLVFGGLFWPEFRGYIKKFKAEWAESVYSRVGPYD